MRHHYFIYFLISVFFSTSLFALKDPDGYALRFGDNPSITPIYDPQDLYYDEHYYESNPSMIPRELRRKYERERDGERRQNLRERQQEYAKEKKQRIEELQDFCAGEVIEFDDRVLCQNFEQHQNFGMPLEPEDLAVIEPHPMMPEPYGMDDYYAPEFDDYYSY